MDSQLTQEMPVQVGGHTVKKVVKFRCISAPVSARSVRILFASKPSLFQGKKRLVVLLIVVLASYI